MSEVIFIFPSTFTIHRPINQGQFTESMHYCNTGMGWPLAFKAVLGVLFVVVGVSLRAQPTGGRAGLSFLQLPANARTAAVGSRHLTLPGGESSQFLNNPSLLDTSKIQNASLTLIPYLADTRLLTTTYAFQLKKMKGVWAGGIQYFDYGTLVETDDLGNQIGEFRAADYALSVGYGHTIQNITIGGSAKLVGSMIENYQLWGLAMDWGATFRHPSQDLTAGFVVKNLGFIRQNYAGGEAPPLPFDVRIGVTFKPEYMPLRFSVTAHHLNAFDMVYNDPALFFSFDSNGNRTARKVPLPEKIFRHLTLGAELLLHPKFRLMVGYDHLLRQELRLQDRPGLAGITGGAWLRIKRFEFSYGHARFNAGIAAHTASIHARFSK